MAVTIERDTRDRVEVWIDALVDRHTREFSTSEFLKAVRALSVRYVERRSELGARSPIDSAGKRAAFAAFFAPLHFCTVAAIVHALGIAADAGPRLLDLGCGTGVAGAAWAQAGARTELTGVDLNAWALSEAAWNWRTLGLRGHIIKARMVEKDGLPRQIRSAPSSVVLGWSANELDDDDRARLLPLLLERQRRGTSTLVIEPLARTAVPWWNSWEAAIVAAGGRADEWKLERKLPARIAAIDEAAGFRRDVLGARSLWLPGRASGS